MKHQAMNGARVGDIRVQCDRWPLDGSNPTAHVLTVICVSLHAGRPSKDQIIQQLRDSIDILRQTP